jgi:hypothetical protein
MRSGFDVLLAAGEYRAAERSGEARESLDARLRTVREAVARNFDDRIALQTHEAEELTRRVETLRAEIDERRGERDDTIDRAVENVRRGDPPPRPR